jgi:hypothetical protein
VLFSANIEHSHGAKLKHNENNTASTLMKLQTCLSIRYRDFYDVPRLVIAESAGRWYLPDCLLNDDNDVYADHFVACRLPVEAKFGLSV